MNNKQMKQKIINYFLKYFHIDIIQNLNSDQVSITYLNLSKLQTNNVYLSLVNNIDGISSHSMAFPSSHTSDSGGNGMPDYTSTEAFWYFVEIALENNDLIFTQQLLNGYNYLIEQKNFMVKSSGVTYQNTPGMAGWQPYISIPNTNFNQSVYSTSNTQYWSTATDADEHIITMFNYASKYLTDIYYCSDGNLTNTNGIVSYNSLSSTTIQNILTQSVNTFLTSNISNFPTSNYDTAHKGFYYPMEYNNGSWTPSNISLVYNPVLTNDNFGGGTTIQYNGLIAGTTGLNPSYFDPITLETIYQLSQTTYSNNTFIYNDYSNNTIMTFNNEQITSNYFNSIKNSIIYLMTLQSDYIDPVSTHINSFGLPDNPYWNEGEIVPKQENAGKIGPHYVGYDSIRFLSNVGKFVYMYNKNSSSFSLFNSTDYNNILLMGIRMCNYIISNSQNLFEPNMILMYPDQTYLESHVLLGPLTVIMYAILPYINNSDQTSPYYSTITSDNLNQIINSLNSLAIDTSQFVYNSTNPSNGWMQWQSNYYSCSLILVNKYYLNQMINNLAINL